MITTIEGAIVSVLANDPATVALVGSRIRPITDPQQAGIYPFITYQRLRTARTTDNGGFSNGGPTGFAQAEFQVDAWANSLLSAKQTIRAARIALNGFSGTVGGIGIGCIQVIDERELNGQLYDGQTKPIQHEMIEIRVSYQDT